MSTRQTFASVPEYLSSLEPAQAKALAKQRTRPDVPKPERKPAKKGARAA